MYRKKRLTSFEVPDQAIAFEHLVRTFFKSLCYSKSKVNESRF